MASSKKLKILFCAPEVDPFVKAGGLADVARSLPLKLKELGHDVRVIMPRHYMAEKYTNRFETVADKASVSMDGERINFSVKMVKLKNSVPVYMIDNSGFFAKRSAVYGYVDDVNRFAFFCMAILKVPELIDWKPDVIHTNDWLTGLVPNYLKTLYGDDDFYEGTATVFSIHNLAYQGVFNQHVLREDEKDDGGDLPRYDSVRFQTVNFMKRGIIYADQLTTVSEQYAKEITTPEYGEGLDALLRERRMDLTGILNGIDYKKYDPATDPHIAKNYEANSIDDKAENKLAFQRDFNLKEDPDVPMLGIASRFASQKGFDLLAEIIDPLLRQNVQLAIVGEGDPQYHELFWQLTQEYPKKVGAHLKFDRVVAQKIYAAADIFLMPSRYEPCGIGQLISMRYGTIPVAHATGGLADTVHDFCPETGRGNGFTFGSYDPLGLFRAITRALETRRYKGAWGKMVKRAMKLEYSWDKAAEKYEKVYARALDKKRGG